MDKRLREFENSWGEAHFLGKNNNFKSVLSKGKKIIDPLAELGIIPHQSIITLFNEHVDKNS